MNQAVTLNRHVFRLLICGPVGPLNNCWGYQVPRMLKLLILALAIFPYAWAAEARLPANAIERLVLAYANSLGCEVHFDKKNILPYAVEGEASFIALYSIDLGCSGGSAMSRPALAIIGTSTYGNKFYIRPKYSNPEQMSMDFPAATYEIYLKGGEVRFRAKDLAASDALCCPSIPVDGLVTFRDGFWIDGTKR